MTRHAFFPLMLFLPLLCFFSMNCGASNGLPVKKTFKAASFPVKEFTIRENDTLTYKLKLALDENGKPQYFFRNIFTPVCYTNECKPVYINFYWDLLGNFMRYDLPEGKILTKIDHDEFKKEDYEKLSDILSRSTSIFADLKMEDLMTKGTDSLADNVDAKTGATLKTIKNEVIDGAVYTCFTLWHIAYGKKVINRMVGITDSLKTDEMLHNFLASSNYHYQYWAMEKVMSKSGSVKKEYEKDIQQVIQGKNLFTARTALQKTSNDFFSGSQRQNWLWDTYQSAPYPMQVAILKKLESFELTTPLIEKLSAGAVDSNSEQFRLKMGILTKQKQLSESALLLLANNLKNDNSEYTDEIYEVLAHFHPASKEIRAKMEQYKSK
jgi:hypothetical protein